MTNECENKNPYVIPDAYISELYSQVSSFLTKLDSLLSGARGDIENAKSMIYTDSSVYGKLVDALEKIDSLEYVQKTEKKNIENILAMFLTMILKSGIKLELPENWINTVSSKSSEENEDYFSIHIFDADPKVRISTSNSATETLSGTSEGLFGNSFVNGKMTE
jgi:hypothetical protein